MGHGHVLGIALGETQAAAERLVAERFPSATVTWLDRHDPRLRPWRAPRGTFDDVVLYVPDAGASRVRLTALLAALPHARSRWLADPTGLKPFTPASHLSAHLGGIARHSLALVAALLLARPLLALGLRYLQWERRRPRWGRPSRMLYLRGQFWFGLRGGGSVGHTSGVISGLRTAGTEVRVVASDHLHDVDAPTHVLPPERWFGEGAAREIEELAYNGPFALAALRAARRWRPEAIYQRYTAFNVAGAILSRALNVPLVLEFNSSDVWKARHWGEFKQVGLAALGEQVNLAAADRVVVVSRVLREDLVAAGVPAGKVLVNPNAVNPDRFRPDASGAEEARAPFGSDVVVVGFSGTFGRWHGVRTLAEALPLVLKQRPDVRFLLVGDGPLRGQVELVVRQQGLGRQVRFAGLVPYERMPAHLAACDVLLSPHGRQVDGREFFGSPTKLYEYMAAGRAIVASRVGQIGEVLRDQENALLVEPENSEALVSAILRLAGDPELRRRLGAAAREQAVREHTWRQNAERVLGSLERTPATAPTSGESR